MLFHTDSNYQTTTSTTKKKQKQKKTAYGLNRESHCFVLSISPESAGFLAYNHNYVTNNINFCCDLGTVQRKSIAFGC